MIQVLNTDGLSLPLEFFAQFDHWIGDPPYSGHVHANARSTRSEATGGPTARDLGFAALTPEARLHTARGLAKVRRWSVVFSDFAKGTEDPDDDAEAEADAGRFVLEGDCAWRFQAVHAGCEWIRLVPWIRWSQPQITGDRPPSGAEAVLHFHAKNGRKPVAKHWNGPGGLTCYDWESLRGDDKHPTEKPLALMLDLICFFTDPGEAVLDTFGGRGTTAQACRLLGRECVLVERLEHFADAAQTRITSPLDARDLAQVTKWIERRAPEAERDLAAVKFPTTVRRAESRLADVQRVIATVAAI